MKNLHLKKTRILFLGLFSPISILSRVMNSGGVRENTVPASQSQPPSGGGTSTNTSQPIPSPATPSTAPSQIQSQIQMIFSIVKLLPGISQTQMNSYTSAQSIMGAVTDPNAINTQVIPQVLALAKDAITTFLKTIISHKNIDKQLTQQAQQLLNGIIFVDLTTCYVFINTQILPLVFKFNNDLITKSGGTFIINNNTNNLIPSNQNIQPQNNSIIPGVPTPSNSPVIPSPNQAIWNNIKNVIEKIPFLGKTADEQNIAFLKNLLGQMQTINNLTQDQKNKISQYLTSANTLMSYQIEKLIQLDQNVYNLVQDIQASNPDSVNVLGAVLQTISQFIKGSGKVPNWNPVVPNPQPVNPNIKPINPPNPNQNSVLDKIYATVQDKNSLINVCNSLSALPYLPKAIDGSAYILIIAEQPVNDSQWNNSFSNQIKTALSQIFSTQSQSIKVPLIEMYVDNNPDFAFIRNGIEAQEKNRSSSNWWYQFYPGIYLTTVNNLITSGNQFSPITQRKDVDTSNGTALPTQVLAQKIVSSVNSLVSQSQNQPISPSGVLPVINPNNIPNIPNQRHWL
jgi:hypothetical protein